MEHGNNTLFTAWRDHMVQTRRASMDSMKIYQSMWNKLCTSSSSQSSLLSCGLQELHAVVSLASANSATSYPKRMAQLVSRVLVHHDPEHVAGRLPSLFVDQRRSTPAYLGGSVEREALTAPEDGSKADWPSLGWKVPRNFAMAAIALYAGLKLHEILALKVQDLRSDADGYILNVLGQRRRKVPVSGRANKYLVDWIEARFKIVSALETTMREQGKAFDPSRIDHLFLGTATGRPVSRVTAYRVIRDVLKSTFGTETGGLDSKSFTAGASRNTFAIRQVQHGIPQAVITEWLGYQSPDTISGRVEAFQEASGKKIKKPASQQLPLLKVRPV